MYDMSFCIRFFVFFNFLNIKDVKNGLVFLIFSLLRVQYKNEGSICQSRVMMSFYAYW